MCLVLTQALQKAIGDSILNRQLQQQVAEEGFIVSQLDAPFERQGVFSSDHGTFLVDIADTTEVGGHCCYAEHCTQITAAQLSKFDVVLLMLTNRDHPADVHYIFICGAQACMQACM